MESEWVNNGSSLEYLSENMKTKLAHQNQSTKTIQCLLKFPVEIFMKCPLQMMDEILKGFHCRTTLNQKTDFFKHEITIAFLRNIYTGMLL